MNDGIAFSAPTRAFMRTLRPWAIDQAPPNFIAADEGTTRLRTSYGDDKFVRLVALKDKYDPENVFALNQNIPPSRRHLSDAAARDSNDQSRREEPRR